MTNFAKGEFVLEYRGDLINAEESRRRQRVYHSAMKGFMFDFIWQENSGREYRFLSISLDGL